MRKYYFFVLFISLFSILFICPSIPTEKLTRGSGGTLNPQGYLLNFPLSKARAGNINIYMPEYKAVSPETAKFYGALFNMDEIESEEYYAYKNQEGSIYIDKNIGHLRYEAAYTPEQAGAAISHEEAMKKALQFIESRLLFLSYDESKVRFDGDLYEVVFVNLLSNIQNYAHPIRVGIDPYGHVLNMDYYFIEYKRLGSSPIKSMAEAFEELPSDFPEGIKIPLTQCRLVYFYENSVLQPAYLFEGNYPNDKSFSAFVKASTY